MPITALQGYDGRAFESAVLNNAGTILTLTRGNGSTKDIVLPASTGGAGGGTTPAVQVGYEPHYMLFNDGGLQLPFAGIRSVSFWMLASVAGEYMADGRIPGGSGGYWYYGEESTFAALVNGVAAPSGDNFACLLGGVWRLVYIDYTAAAAGFNLFANVNGTQFFNNASIADLRVYSRKWTSAEKANTDPTKVPTDSLLARYDFTSVTSTQVIDQSGNATSNNATFIKTPGTVV